MRYSDIINLSDNDENENSKFGKFKNKRIFFIQ